MLSLRNIVTGISLVICSSSCWANYSVSILKFEPVAVEENGQTINTFNIEVAAQGEELDKEIYIVGHSQSTQRWIELPLEYLYDNLNDQEVWGLNHPTPNGSPLDFTEIAVKYQTPESEVWDNNAGKNYPISSFNPFSLTPEQQIKLVKVELVNKRERLRIHLVARKSLQAKALGVQWTQNNWASKKDIAGVINQNAILNGDDIEAWYVDLPLNNQSATFSFKLFADTDDNPTQWLWHDNHGDNYAVTTECRPENCILSF
jgi:hypothetical protein|tara:strand:- start:473 stop:1252 length:780 start_codon:yes stop_codon:yes gene_type:complete